MGWFLNPALTRWRNEVNARYPRRDKTTDGTIGDRPHSLRTSDHNPDPDGSVDAWDMDRDLVPGNVAESRRIIKEILIPVFQRHPAARYWIFERQIAHVNNGWRKDPYDGDSPHTEHVHFNSNQATEKNTSPWFTEEKDDMATTAAQDGALKALLTGSGSGAFNEANNLHVKLNAILKAVQLVDEAVIESLRDESTPEEQAQLLRAILGDRAKEVGQLLANG